MLGKPSSGEKVQIDRSIESALNVLSLMIDGEWEQAMTLLNSAPCKEYL